MTSYRIPETAAWWSSDGNDNNIIISSRARLSRNLPDIPFPHHASSEQRLQVADRTASAIESIDAVSRHCTKLSIDDVNPLSRRILVERGLLRTGITHDNVVLYVEQNEQHAITVNGEDHVRFSAVANGRDLDAVYRRVNGIERELEHTLDFSFDTDHGYHTAAVADLGTGLRLSFMVHIPLLIWESKEKLERILTGIVRKGGIIRGLRGEKSRSIGDMIQIASQATLGVSEDDVISMMDAFAQTLVTAEERMRERVYKRDRTLLEDKIYRSLAMLAAARSITYIETVAFLSWLRVGVSLELFPIPLSVLTKAFFTAQKGHICYGGDIEKKNVRDVKRADMLRAVFRPYAV
ncbi:MAG: hypothetical protein HZC28_10315 [Spirochaetes bacterium]|nr:hypothetical protein [Spirochaetota bacterium]